MHSERAVKVVFLVGLMISVEIDLRKRVEAEGKDSEKTHLWT